MKSLQVLNHGHEIRSCHQRHDRFWSNPHKFDVVKFMMYGTMIFIIRHVKKIPAKSIRDTLQNVIRDKEAGRMKSADDEREKGRQVEKNTTWLQESRRLNGSRIDETSDERFQLKRTTLHLGRNAARSDFFDYVCSSDLTDTASEN